MAHRRHVAGGGGGEPVVALLLERGASSRAVGGSRSWAHCRRARGGEGGGGEGKDGDALGLFQNQVEVKRYANFLTGGLY